MSCSNTLRFLIFPGRNRASVSPTASSTTNTISRISDVGEEVSGDGVGDGVGSEGVVTAGVSCLEGSGVGCSSMFGVDTLFTST